MLTQREIANQEIETYRKQRASQEERIAMENAKGTAEMQADLAKSKVGVDIKTNNANARTEEARGEAEFIRQTGTAKGAEVEAVGLARARGYEAQVRALGSNATALVNVITALADGSSKFVPDILVTSGSNGGAHRWSRRHCDALSRWKRRKRSRRQQIHRTEKWCAPKRTNHANRKTRLRPSGTQ